LNTGMNDRKPKPADDRIRQKLREANLFLAAEAFGEEPEPGRSEAIDSATCSDAEFVRRVQQIAEITGDRLLAERIRQREQYQGLVRSLSPTTVSVLKTYSQRFYSFWDAGKQVFIQSDLADFREWYNRVVARSEEIFTPEEMERTLAMSCSRDQVKKSPLLVKLLDNVADTEAIRIGYLYPVREMSFEILSDLFTKLKELLLIRDMSDSALQLGDHPEELIPYAWANIIKSLLNGQLNDALDHINILAYVHYAAQQTESKITGTDAYTKLKKEFVLFNQEIQRNWPNEIRKMYLDPAIQEMLDRYRFAHGLVALNTHLAFVFARGGGGKYLEDRDEDVLVYNGLILTQTGYVKSSGFDDKPVRDQFLRDTAFFRELIRDRRTLQSSPYLHRHRLLKRKHREIGSELDRIQAELDQVLADLTDTIGTLEVDLATARDPEKQSERSGLVKWFGKKETAACGMDPESLHARIEAEKDRLNRLSEVRKLFDEVSDFMEEADLFLR